MHAPASSRCGVPPRPPSGIGRERMPRSCANQLPTPSTTLRHQPHPASTSRSGGSRRSRDGSDRRPGYASRSRRPGTPAGTPRPGRGRGRRKRAVTSRCLNASGPASGSNRRRRTISTSHKPAERPRPHVLHSSHKQPAWPRRGPPRPPRHSSRRAEGLGPMTRGQPTSSEARWHCRRREDPPTMRRPHVLARTTHSRSRGRG